jgi:integrase
VLNLVKQNRLTNLLYDQSPFLARIFIFGVETGLHLSAIKSIKLRHIDAKTNHLYYRHKQIFLSKIAVTTISEQIKASNTPIFPSTCFFDTEDIQPKNYISILQEIQKKGSIFGREITNHVHRLCFLNNQSQDKPTIYTVN